MTSDWNLPMNFSRNGFIDESAHSCFDGHSFQLSLALLYSGTVNRATVSAAKSFSGAGVAACEAIARKVSSAVEINWRRFIKSRVWRTNKCLLVFRIGPGLSPSRQAL